MCIIADSVREVDTTKIASFHVAYSINGSTDLIPAQFVAYAAKVDSLANSNAFILPVYNPGNDYRTIIPLDLSKLPDFFDSVSNVFESWFPEPKQYFSTNSYSTRSASTPLPVFQVGDFKFSIMPSSQDFNRLDRTKLNVNPIAKAAIDAHSQDYSFIVYQFFQRGMIDITPFGYICRSKDDLTMVVPTIHGHPHNSVPTTGLGYTGRDAHERGTSLNGYIPNLHVTYGSDFEDTADYDHVIYTLNKVPPIQSTVQTADVKALDRILKGITKDYMNRGIRIYVPRGFKPNRIKITGSAPNRNIYVTPEGYRFAEDLSSLPEPVSAYMWNA